MAETKVIEIRTLEAIQNVRDLKDNIAALKAKIDDVDTSTEEYSELTKQLSQNQAALRNVMNGTNSTFEVSIQDAQGLSTSYNSLVQQLKEATQEWRAIPKYLTEADRAQGIVNKAWQDAAGKVFDLRTELKSMDADTNSFVRNVGNYKSALEGFGGTMGRVQQVGGDMVNGISAAASSLAILGINTEGLDDSMKNLRVVIAAVQGAKGFAGLLSQLKNYFTAGKNATKVTQQQTAATQAQTVAQTAANVATKEGTVAMTGLQKALIATGIGALVVALGMLVAHFEDIVKWVGGVLEKFGILKKSTDDLKDANKKLNDKFEEQNHALANQQKLLTAQGTSNKTLLIQKQQLINSQINDTKVTIENVKARIKQIEADARWWKFWQGTKGKLKEANEELAELEKTLKTLQQSAEDIKVDIQVEGIKEGQKAVEKAKKDAEEALKLAKKIVDDGVKAATKEIQAQETEVQKIQREYKEQVDLINSAITATQKLTGQTKTLEILNNGLVAADKNRVKALQDYYQKEYEKKAAEHIEKIQKSTMQQYAEAERYEKIMKDVLNLDSFRAKKAGEATAAQKRQYDTLKATVDLLRSDIEITDLKPYMNMTDEEIRKELGEPLATAIKLYFQKSKELEDAGMEMASTIFEAYENAFNEQLENGNFYAAASIANKFGKEFYDKFKEMGLEQEIIDYFVETFDKVSAQAQLDDVMPQGFNVVSMLFPQAEIDQLQFRVDVLRDEMKRLEEGTTEFYETQERLSVLEEQLFKKRIGRFSAFFTELGKYYNVYGKATSNVMDSVADAWEAALQAQVKTGKKSEEEAKRSFENVKTLQYASAIINTAGAVVQALADPTVPSYYVKIANAAAALAAGTAQVLKISMTEFSSNASSNTVSAPTPVDRTPQLNYTIGLNTQEYAQAAAETPIRAYVVDRDLADGLDQYNRREDQTTF